MNKLKQMILMTLMAAVMVILPMSAKAADTTSYRMDSGYNRTTTVGDYQVKYKDSYLYAKKKTASSWTKIASASGRAIECFTTNGSMIYYSASNYNYSDETGNSKIYSITVTGKNKTLLRTLSYAVESIYRYNSMLYLCRRAVKYDSTMYKLSLNTNKLYKVGEELTMVNGYLGYAAVMDGPLYKWSQPLYSMNLSTKTKTKLASNVFDYYTTGAYIYYAAYTEETSIWDDDHAFYIRRCRADGSLKKTMTTKLYGYIEQLTSSKVVYTYNGVTRTCYF